ncbi:MAG: transcription-repair coupling factor [Actinobacteria bacterium]|nr:transcription-repair coupling factor [Actinomycetota bacterium]
MTLTSQLAKGGGRAYAPSFLQGAVLASVREELWPDDVMLIVAPGSAEAAKLVDDLAAYARAAPVRLLPSRGTTLGSRLTPSCQSVGMRHAALAIISDSGPGIVVADVTALQERGLDAGNWPEPVTVGRDSGLGFEAVIEGLAALGYERVQQVEDRGQFAVRGGIIDFFPCTDSTPVRLEYWGDEFESLRRFSPYTQRSLLQEEKVTAFAAVEPGTTLGGEATGGKATASGLLSSKSLAARIVRLDPDKALQSVRSFWEDAVETSSEEETAAYYLSPAELEEQLEEQLEEAAAGSAMAAGDSSKSLPAGLILESLPADQPVTFAATSFTFTSRKPAAAARQLARMVREDFRIFIHFSSEGAARRAEHQLEGEAKLLKAGELVPQKPGAYLIVAPQPIGFISREMKLAVCGERAFIRPSRAARSQQLTIAGKAIMSFRDLTPGDFIVHEDHGIGVFIAVETKTVSGVTRDYLHLRFKGDDKLFVPQEQISKVSRYVGAQSGEPPLNKLGGRAWAQARAKARGAAKEMAGELLQLYSVRQGLPGYEFGPDDQWQTELESAFPYEETPDQATAIEDVKDDMESPHPMDRLICGDVGYGKTEVALRAAFKAASQDKQVLMLVPTTILALQHFKTFSQRFSPYPVNVEMISRFRSQAESRRIAAAFRKGEIDVLIGTHRLLSTDVAPHDLGLVIVDEEQRFGVAQKEMLRQLRLQVDVLSLSATPIPRTLQMSLSGIRDISVMETPPAGRYPIRTYVGGYDDETVTQAIGREVERGGQVFFLHNRVESITEVAEGLQSLMPDVKFTVAHGQMPEKELESVMVSFLEREADVLVCTSIIESGLDIPTANTLIVDRADMLGLSQLYQIRGRIGRSDKVAHAYLFYPPEAELTREAMARLSTLSDYTELGSGFRIAMRDLEIRGAGNLLGDEQSGHVAAVGFEMYCDLLREAVAELQDQPVAELKVARLELDVDAYIPADYIPFEAARIDVHHRIAGARDEEKLESIREELRDRFGEVPEVVENLLEMQAIRLKGAVIGAATIVYRRGRLELGDLRIDGFQRQQLEEAGHKFAYYALRRQLVLWPPVSERGGEGDDMGGYPGGDEGGDGSGDGGLSVVSGTLDAIIDSLFTSNTKL